MDDRGKEAGFPTSYCPGGCLEGTECECSFENHNCVVLSMGL